MAARTLKVTFSGINTLTPAMTDASTTVAHVMMPARREDFPGDPQAIPQHKAFVYVLERYVVSPPNPADVLTDAATGETVLVYHLDHARAHFDPIPASPPRYFTDAGKPILERPGSSDVASAQDIRWMADLREIVPAANGFAPGCDPSQPITADTLAMIVDVQSGIFKSNFPCATVQPQVFFAGLTRLDIRRRVYPQEFTVEMTYPAGSGDIRLVFEPLRAGIAMTGVDGGELVLRWQNDRIDLRIGNDTTREISAIADRTRCDLPTESGPPMPNDFVLHYNTVNLHPALARPVPLRGTLHTEHNGCLGVRNGG